MRKSTKVVLIVAACLLIVGGILTGAGYALGGMKAVQMTVDGPRVFSSSNLVQIEVDAAELSSAGASPAQLTGIDIQSDISEIRLVEGSELSLSVGYDSGYSDFEWSVESNILVVRNLQRPGFHGMFGSGTIGFGVNTQHQEIVLTYPRDLALDSLNIHASLGSVKVDGLAAENAWFDLDAGDLSIANLDCATLSVNVDLGRAVIARSTVSESATARLSAGDFEVTESSFHNLDANCDLGRAAYSGTLTGEAYFSLSMGDGELDLDQPLTGITYHLSCDLGSIRVNGSAGSGGEGPSSYAEHEASGTETLRLDVNCNMGSVRIDTR
jgi:hypothetical protein